MSHKDSKVDFSSLYPKLNAEQKKSLQLIEQKKSVCNTGPGGSGKTWFTNEVIKLLPEGSTAVTATTALAAKALPRGQTLHRFLGIGVRHPDEMERIRQIHRDTKVLIIDEISMASADFMDEASAILQKSRRGKSKNNLPFGGIQLLCVGDFLQLPPVSKRGEEKEKLAYHSKAWRAAKIQTIEFTEIKRQAGDDTFKEMLNEIRFGHVSAKTDKALRSRINAKLNLPDGVKPSSLFAVRKAVAELNARELEKLPGRSTSFYAQDSSPYEGQPYFAALQEQADKQLRCPRELKLREGAQVVLLRNKYIEDGLVNGSRGVVIGFRQPDGKEDKQQKTTKSKYTKEELELLQMVGFKPVEEDDDDERTQDSHVMFQAMKKEAKQTAPASTELLPIVKFENGVKKVIGRADFDIEEQGKKVLIRNQIPLDLAWGLTIHACQGMTLTAVSVSFARMFESGQVYVALSRCPRLDCVTITDYDSTKIKADLDAVQFYRNLAQGKLPVDTKAQEQKQAFIKMITGPGLSSSSSSNSSSSSSGNKRKRDDDDDDDDDDADSSMPVKTINVNGVWVSVASDDHDSRDSKRRRL